MPASGRSSSLAWAACALGLGACTDALVVARVAADAGTVGVDAATASPDASREQADALAVPGLEGAYYDNRNLAGAPAFERIDPALDVLWTGSPAPGVGPTFSVRWTGALVPPAPGVYQMRLTSDDGSRLWIDDVLLIDQWKGAPNSLTVEVDLSRGRRHPIRVELFSYGGNASLRLTAARGAEPAQIVSGDWLSTAP